MAKNVSVTNCYDVCGHIDYVVRYGKEREINYVEKDVIDLIDIILKKIIYLGKGIELNTAGLKYGLPFAHPAPFVLKRYRELGGEIITVGSDGHMPKHLGWEFSKASEILENNNFKYVAVYRKRKPKFIKI